MKVNNEMKYMPQLDCLRSIAVFLVIISHWFSEKHILNRYTPNGQLGVTLFFVLSGFLITGILIQSKLLINHRTTIKNEFKRFYIRRSFRIFPIYYLLLLILWMVNDHDFINGAFWHLFYASNFLFYFQNAFSGNVSHFWSLAVEEQFYLIWPAIIFYTPLKYLNNTFIIGIIIGIIFRIMVSSPQSDLGRLLMPGSLDSFCIGGMFSFGKFFKKNWYEQIINVLGKSLIALIFVYVAFVFIERHYNIYWLHNAFYYTIISLIFGLIIIACSNGVKSKLIGAMLNNHVLIYLGKISYGLYLYHNFIPYIYDIKLPGTLNYLSIYFVQFTRMLILIGIASISWFLVERPMLKIKNRITKSPLDR